ncbi:MAG: NAD(P)H-dependent oxidoreductase subunit E [Burkholderiaceae bacterium]|nr:NAD(P)H-dependent oxidoreductase subunit E [Burkholderiales bacterium]MCZ8336696.1 NAD(P)H-dependent oxidoreductase subunit E [Burkholderiaceae bacterium]
MERPLHFRRPVGRPKGRPLDSAVAARVADLLADLPRRPDLLIEALHRVQDAERHLSSAAIAAIADAFRMSQAEVFEVATFYHHFDVVRDGGAPPPALTVRVCDSISCAIQGADALADALAAGLPADTVRVQRVPCVGRCDRAPVAIVDRHPVEHAAPDAVRAALDAGARECAPPDALPFDHALAAGAYAQLRGCLDGGTSRDAVFAALEASGLRGLGGAGFPTHRKWRTVAAQPGPRLMAVNADEGEPGTFKDRVWLETAPHRILEGMLIGAWAVGASAVYLYLRDEYAGVRAWLERELPALRAWLSEAWPAGAGAAPEVHLRRGAGAYVCGEESAMIESIEGRRGMPRLRPPYVAQVGLFGRPTLVNNPETLMWVATILERGAADYASNGRRGRVGLRSFSVSGRVREPGVKLAPAGITLRELVDEYCGGMADGHALYGFLPGGASGGILPASLADVPLDFDTLAPHGALVGSCAVVVLSERDRARDAAANLLRFFRHESCGQCTPCRAGTAKAEPLLESPAWDAALLGELSRAMRDASICGLGQAAPNPFDSVLRYFPHEVSKG